MSWELPFLLWGCFIFFHRKDTLLASLRLLVLFLSPFTWAMFSLEFFKPCSSVFCFRRQCTQDGSLLWKTHRSPLCCCTAEKENVLSSACPSQSFKTNHALHNHLPNTSSNTVKEVKEEQGKNKVCSTLNQPSFAQQGPTLWLCIQMKVFILLCSFVYSSGFHVLLLLQEPKSKPEVAFNASMLF